ncbi:MAG: hypothetical protein ACRD7E_10515 [Bryobacteraceae bacterium]
MDTIPLKPERQAELERFARERGKDPVEALDDALAAYLEWERGAFEADLTSVEEGYEALKSGRTHSLEEFDQHMRRKYGIPR